MQEKTIGANIEESKGSMGLREKKLRVIDMRGCGWIPCRLGICPTAWHKYRE